MLTFHVSSSGNVFNSSGTERTATPRSKAKEGIPFFKFFYLKELETMPLYSRLHFGIWTLYFLARSVLLDTLPVWQAVGLRWVKCALDKKLSFRPYRKSRITESWMPLLGGGGQTSYLLITYQQVCEAEPSLPATTCFKNVPIMSSKTIQKSFPYAYGCIVGRVAQSV